MRVNCEKTRNAPPFLELLGQELEEHLVLGRSAHFAGRFDRQEARIAAHLAKLHQRVENRDGRSRDAHLLDGSSHLRVRRDSDALIELALIAQELDRANELGLGRELASNLLFHATQHEGSDTRAESRKLVGAVFRVERTIACPGTARRCRGARASGTRRSTTALPSCFRSVFRSSKADAPPAANELRA